MNRVMRSSIPSSASAAVCAMAMLLALPAFGAEPDAGAAPATPPDSSVTPPPTPPGPDAKPPDSAAEAPPATPPTPPVPPPAPNPKELAARKEFEAAQREYDLGRFERAIDHYSRAYEAMPLPPFLFNIAQCHRHLNRYDRAAFFYRRYLDLAGQPQNAALTKELLAEMETRQREKQERERVTAENAARALAPLPPPETPAPPLHRRWYVWAAAGGVVAATATAVALAVTQPPQPTLGTIHGR